LVVVGGGPQLEQLQRSAKPHIQFRTWVGARELRELYRHARGFVFTAQEDYGIAPIEAQACGCPVLAFGRGGVRETVRDGETGLFFSEQSAESLIEGLDRFSAHKFDAEAIRANAVRFNPQRFREEFLACLSRVIS